jgi:cyclopropane fatty-acyl-phospholipid synthase-like methyltransferase
VRWSISLIRSCLIWVVNLGFLAGFFFQRSDLISQAQNTNRSSDVEKNFWEKELQEKIGKDGSLEYKRDLTWGALGNPWTTWMAQPEMAIEQYEKIRNKTLDYTDETSVVLELGAWDGAWTRIFLQAKEIICVDLSKQSEYAIRKRYPAHRNIEFYLASGNDLAGIPTGSVDFIFAMDCLMRADVEDIRSYLKEFKRILSDSGSILLNLPCTSKILSVKKRFTPLNKKQIRGLLAESFDDFSIDNRAIWHGLIIDDQSMI